MTFSTQPFVEDTAPKVPKVSSQPRSQLLFIFRKTSPGFVLFVSTLTHWIPTTHTNTREMNSITFTLARKSATLTAQSPLLHSVAFHHPNTITVDTHTVHICTDKEALLSNMGVADYRWCHWTEVALCVNLFECIFSMLRQKKKRGHYM